MAAASSSICLRLSFALSTVWLSWYRNSPLGGVYGWSVTLGLLDRSTPSSSTKADMVAVPAVLERIVPVVLPSLPVTVAGCTISSSAPRLDERRTVLPQAGSPLALSNCTVIVAEVTPSAGRDVGCVLMVERFGSGRGPEVYPPTPSLMTKTSAPPLWLVSKAPGEVGKLDE